MMTNETMTTHCCGSKAPHEIKGRNNFKIECMLDECGDSASNDKIESIQVWHKDGKNKFEVTLKREDFWFQNAAMCERFCGINKITLKCWKRTDEARVGKSHVVHDVGTVRTPWLLSLQLPVSPVSQVP